MRPRRGTPWKVSHRGQSGVGNLLLQCGHGGELRGKGDGRRIKKGVGWRFNAATEGNSVESRSGRIRALRWPGLQCGHGGELRGKLHPSALAHAPQSGASMRPRRGTPWKERSPSTCLERRSWASMRPRRGTPWKANYHRPSVPRMDRLQCGHGGELRGKRAAQ